VTASSPIYDQTLRELLAQLDDGRIGLVVPKEDDPETVHAFLLKAYPDVCDFVERLARQAQAQRN
jgi:hypothetical protein